MDSTKQALTNRIKLTFDRDKIDKDFSIFAIVTDEDYIRKGAAILDDPNEELKALSLVFDYGRTAWIMFRKSDNITNIDILKFIEKDEKNKGHFTVTQKSSYDLEKDYLLLRLFLYSLNLEKKEKYTFNNLTGKLFISNSDWVNSNGIINALQIDVDWQLDLSVSYTTFTRITKFDKDNSSIFGMPRYTWSGNDFMLKRTFDNSIDEKSIFVHTSVNKKTKAHMSFYDYTVENRKNMKVYYAYLVLNALKERYSDYFKNQPSFVSLDVVNEEDTLDDKKYMDNVISHFVGDNALSLRFINLCQDGNDDILDTMEQELCKILNDGDGVITEMTRSERFIPAANTCYIVLHHNADYYKNKKIEDPYKKLQDRRYSIPIQSITVEDSESAIKKGSLTKNDNIQAFYKTILKELVIKNDIINKKEITIDKWESRSYKKNWVFGIEQDSDIYVMIVFPDGSFKVYENKDNSIVPFNCDYEEVNKAVAILRDSKDKTKSIVVDEEGNALLLYKSGMLVMPKEEILGLDHSLHNRSIINEFFTGGYDTTIYQRGSYTYYSSGIPHSSDRTMPNGTSIYSVKVVKGENTIESLLSTFNVPFVRLEGFTVMPYPFKYVREYADMVHKDKNPKTKKV